MNSLSRNTVDRFALCIALCSSSLFAQQPNPPVPIPSQIKTAQTVFLANAGSRDVNNVAIYNDVYRALAAQNHYQLVARPSDAELSLEISLDRTLSTVTNSNGSIDETNLRLVVRDTETHSLLWTFVEPVYGGFRTRTVQQNLEIAVTKIVNDMLSLSPTTDSTQTSDTTPQKTRFSQSNSSKK